MGSPSRPDQPLLASLEEAFRQGVRSAAANWLPMVALLTSMSAMVITYYMWPAGAAILSAYADWQRAGGLLRTGLAAGFAGGILSELSLIVLRDKGRCTLAHFENMAYRFLIFFLTGMTASIFYDWQAVWFGDGTSWRNILPKIPVDQFGYTVFWSVPFQTIAFRWQVLRFSNARLRSELGLAFIVDCMLPVLVTNWMFWIPGVTLVYAMPLSLQMPLSIFATAMWSILLAGVAKPTGMPDTDMVPGPILTEHNPVVDLVE